MKSGVNQGIQGTNINITADALAVGSKARATSTRISSGTEEALTAIKELREALAALNLDRDTQTQVAATVRELEETVAAPQPQKAQVASVIGRVVATLDKAGTAVTKVAGVAAALGKLAALFGLPIPV